ncbi:hypothetical protein ES703_94590 [subsurface metagenome]|jgi:predicted phosphodiesterase
MKKNFKSFLVILAIILIAVGCTKGYKFKDSKIEGVATILNLDRISVFSFAIMSDNKGDSPKSSKQFESMVKWIKESEDQFVIGLGDHVKRGWENSFLNFLKENRWWHENFYPNVADGENEFYGESQGDWGTGTPILDEVTLSKRSNVKIRDNGCEYYAIIPVKGYTIHLIQLHYSDEPKEDSIAFREDSKRYLISVLRSIDKGPGDIIIVCAHSRNGFWIDQLSDEQKKVVMDKCDLVLSATTHFFERKVIDGYEDRGPLFINTGSITYPYSYCTYGYVQVHVLRKPLSLVVQYINAGLPSRELQHSEYAFVKVVGDKIRETDFRKVRVEENMDRVVGSLSKDYSKDEMDSVARVLYINSTNAEGALVSTKSGLEKGDVTYRELWDVFPYNNEIYSLVLKADEIRRIFGDDVKVVGTEEMELAINNYYGDYLIEELKLTEEKVVKTGKKEIPLLIEWVKKQK